MTEDAMEGKKGSGRMEVLGDRIDAFLQGDKSPEEITKLLDEMSSDYDFLSEGAITSCPADWNYPGDDIYDAPYEKEELEGDKSHANMKPVD